MKSHGLNSTPLFSLALPLSLVVALGGCQGAVRNTMYSAYEKVGVHKRDLLKKRVEKTREEQQESSEEFKDALTHLKELYGYEGGRLEEIYNTVKDDYEDVKKSAADVRESLRKMDQVASDLFAEWETEIGQIQTASLQSQSRRQLQETRRRYDDMHRALVQAERSMSPAIARLQDQTLFLKHNLNANAIASLKGQGSEIQAEINRIIREVTASIKKADRFLESISGPTLTTL